MSLLVRAAGADDLAAVLALERAAAEAPHWGTADYTKIVDCAETAGGRGVLRCLFVAEVAGEVRGFAVGKVAGAGVESVAELESVVVHADARRRGLGRALCGAVAAWCRELGARELELEVRAASAGAIALYVGMGFAPVGRRRGYYSAPADDAVLMRLKLA